MIANHIRIAIKNLVSDKVNLLVNILGLSISVFSSLTILYYISYERSFDDFHVEADNLYQVQHERYKNGELVESSALGPAAMPVALTNDFPAIKSFSRIVPVGGATLKNGVNNFTESKLFIGDSTFFDLFTFPIIRGDQKGALKNPNSIVLSESMVTKIFGDTDPIGKTIEISSETAFGKFTITGVMKDSPIASHLRPSGVISFSTIEAFMGNLNANWDLNYFYSYVLLNDEANAEDLQQQFVPYFEKLFGDKKPNNQDFTSSLMPIADIHLYSDVSHEIETGGDARLLNFLMIISFFIMIMAWINYANLASSQIVKRYKQIGVYKILGASKSHLFSLFLTETILLNLFALVLGVSLTIGLLPYIGELAQTPLSVLSIFSENILIIYLLIFFVAGVFISGLYPAMMLVRIIPTEALLGNANNVMKGSVTRKLLVGFQFTSAMILIFLTLVSFKQLSHMLNHDLGMNIENTMVIKGPNQGGGINEQNISNFINELKTNANVSHVTVSTSVPGEEIRWKCHGLRVRNTTSSNTLSVIGSDYNYLATYENRFLAGRNFSKEMAGDNKSIVINMRAATLLGFSTAEEAVNKWIERPNARDSSFWSLKIVGVVENFHQSSMKSNPDPVIIRYLPVVNTYFSIKGTQNEASTWTPVREFTESKFNNFFPGNPFEHFFLTDFFNSNYDLESRVSRIFGLFALLSLLVNGLGIFGLAMHTMLQQLKSVSIRKILGAGTQNLIYLLTKDIILILVVSAMLGIPLASYITQGLFEYLPYRTQLEWWFFIVPAIVIGLISFATVLYHLVKVLKTNPSVVLRNE